MVFNRGKDKASIIEELEVALTNEKARVASALRKLEDAETRVKLAFAEARNAKHDLEQIRIAVDSLYHIVYPPKIVFKQPPV